MYKATISSKYQISIPKQIREELHIKAGQIFIFIVHGNSIQLVPKRELSDVRGIMSGADTSNSRDRQSRQ